jgi:hypothetical protein
MIRETQSSTIEEEIIGLNQFKLIIFNKFPAVSNFWPSIENFIINSGCKRIEIVTLSHMLGASLIDRVIFNPLIFNQTLPDFLFTVFHEFAHQYQYKKYGSGKMIELYTNDVSIDYAADFMYKTEIVADELATRKLRELVKLNYIENQKLPTGFYKTLPIGNFKQLISTVKSQIPDLTGKNTEEINEILYNWVRKGF